MNELVLCIIMNSFVGLLLALSYIMELRQDYDIVWTKLEVGKTISVAFGLICLGIIGLVLGSLLLCTLDAIKRFNKLPWR